MTATHRGRFLQEMDLAIPWRLLFKPIKRADPESHTGKLTPALTSGYAFQAVKEGCTKIRYRRRCCFSFLFFILFFSSDSHAGWYECIDKSGRVVFKDSPCKINEKLKREIDAPQSVINTVDQDSPTKVDNSTKPVGNLVKNANFDNKLTDWEVPSGIAYWTDNGGKKKGGGLVFEPDEGQPIYNLPEVRLKQCVPFQNGEEFQLSAEFRQQKKITRLYANRIHTVWYESTDCSGGGQGGQYLEPALRTLSWQHVSQTNMLPSLGARSVSIQITYNGKHANGIRTYWDNVVFAITKQSPAGGLPVEPPNKKFTLVPGKNHAYNSAFNEDIYGWSSSWPTVWNGVHGDKARGSAKVTSKSSKGGVGKLGFQQCINFGENTSFELGASFKIDPKSSQKGGGRVRVTWLEKEGCSGKSKTDHSWADPTDMAGWQRLKIPNLHRPANSQSVVIEVIQSVSGAGTFIAYWDDIYFKVVE